MTEPFIGIDFGTCNSSAAWFNPKTGQAETLQNAEGEDKTPSVVYFGPNNETVVGKHAEEQLESPEGRKRVLSAVKRDLAKPSARLMGDRRVTPQGAVTLILEKIKRDAEKLHFHEPVTRAVITCPAVLDEVEKDKLHEAAALAGFRDVVLLEEPVAAAFAYAEAGMNVGRCVLVYDLGGGTFDLALLIREEGEDVFRPAMEPRGERIGGENFDRAIYDYFEALVLKQMDQPICPDGLDLHLLRQCRTLKESLTSIEEPPPLTWYWPGKGQLKLKLNRVRFESLVEKHVERTVRLTQTIQQDAATAGYPLDSVILIGGSSRTPCIVQRLQTTLQVEPTEWQKQYVAVALGAAYHAQRLWGERPRSTPPPEERRVPITPPPSAPGDTPTGPKVTPLAPIPSDPEYLTTTVGQIKLKQMPAGTFLMGSPDDDKDAGDGEKPQHRVAIRKSFYLGVYEITQAQYQTVTGNNPSWFSSTGTGKDKIAGRSTERHPVENVSWLHAVKFCNKLSELGGLRPFYEIKGATAWVLDWNGPGYRLPTEAEWEYACRANAPTPERYSFGDSAGSLGEFAWFSENSGRVTHPVGEKRPNGFGLFDMHGNVWEWCWDWYSHAYYKELIAADDPRGPSVAALRVNRGGSWFSNPRNCRSAYRCLDALEHRSNYLGFRVARVQSGR